MHKVATRTTTIHCGLREDYDGPVHEPREALDLIQGYCDAVGLGVEVTEVTFVYKEGREPGVRLHLFNYPRFPSTAAQLERHALKLAQRLKDGLNQRRVSVVGPKDTILLGPLKDE